MRVKLNSWHFKLYESFYGAIYRDDPPNECKYFWIVVLAVFLISVIAAWVLAAVAFPIFYFYSSLTMDHVVMKLLSFPFGASVFILSLLVLSFTLTVIVDWISNKEDAVGIQYLKAKKDQFCKIIEIED
jgi:hypothetical protein